MSKKLRDLQSRKAELVASMTALNEKADFGAEDQQKFSEYDEQVKKINAAIDREQTVIAQSTSLDLGKEATIISTGDNRAEDENRGFKNFAEYANKVRQASLGGSMPDERLRIGAAVPGTGGNEGTGSDGGYAVPPGFAREIFRLSLSEDSLVGLTDNTEIDNNNMTFPKDETTPWGTDGVRAYWQAEMTAATLTKPVLGSSALRLNKLMALVPLTEELLADQSALQSYLPEKIADSIRWKTNEAILFGTGSGQPSGALNAAASILVAKESGQATGTLNASNLAKMVARLTPGSFPKAQWVINNDVLPALFTLTLGNYPIYVPASAGFQSSPYGMLLGRPIIVSQHANSFSSAGDVNLVDFSYYRTITKAGGMQSATSMHLYFDADVTAFRTTFRIDGGPKIGAPIPPAKGAATLSPFVKLDAR